MSSPVHTLVSQAASHRRRRLGSYVLSQGLVVGSSCSTFCLGPPTKGRRQLLEQALGIPKGYLDGRAVELSRIGPPQDRLYQEALDRSPGPTMATGGSPTNPRPSGWSSSTSERYRPGESHAGDAPIDDSGQNPPVSVPTRRRSRRSSNHAAEWERCREQSPVSSSSPTSMRARWPRPESSCAMDAARGVRCVWNGM
jgi:hypothetical protein